MRKIISFCLLLIMPFFASAAITAQQAIDKAAKKIESAGALTAKFNGSMTGTLISSGKKFSIVADGFGVWYDGKDMWSFSSRAGETTLTSPTPSELLETNPLEIIKVNATKYTATKISENNGNYTLKLTPKTKGDNVKEATLVLNTATWLPTSINILFNNGSNFIINILSITEGGTAPASTFVYPQNTYPGIEVIDLR